MALKPGVITTTELLREPAMSIRTVTVHRSVGLRKAGIVQVQRAENPDKLLSASHGINVAERGKCRK